MGNPNSIDNSKYRVDRIYRVFFFLIAIAPCLLLIINPLDNDIWFLLNSGRYVFAHGFPYVEPFTMHHGFDFVMQQWASACSFWLIYKVLGLVGLRIFTTICYILIILILYRLCLNLSDGNYLISFLATFPASILIAPIITARPGAFSDLILMVELYLLELYSKETKIKFLFPLPLLSIMLVNFHAAMWLMLFVFLLPYIVEIIPFSLTNVTHRFKRLKDLTVIALLMFLCGFANPYGFKAMTYLLRSYGYPEIKSIVGEMHTPTINSLFGIFLYGSMLLIIFAYIFFRTGKTRIRYILLTLGTAYLALGAIRSIPMFAIAGFFPMSYYMYQSNSFAIPTNIISNKTLLLRKILILLISSALILTICLSFQKIQQSDVYSIQLGNAIRHIKDEESPKQIVLYTGYDDGNLAEFLGYKPYLDTRAEVFLKSNNKKANVFIEYYKLQSGKLYYRYFLNKYHFTHLIVTKNDILYTDLLHDADYFISYSNQNYIVFEKKHNSL